MTKDIVTMLYYEVESLEELSRQVIFIISPHPCHHRQYFRYSMRIPKFLSSYVQENVTQIYISDILKTNPKLSAVSRDSRHELHEGTTSHE